MSDTPDPDRSLDEIDRRQDEVLRRLDELNRRVEALLKECLPERDTHPDEERGEYPRPVAWQSP